MNFSELFKQTGQLCKFSPKGQYLASVVQYRLIVRDVQTLQIEQLYTCLDPIQYIEWSSDSQFILCGMYKRGLVQVWSLEQPDWTCKIDEGSAGLSEVNWSPDGRHILTTADFKLRITVWSLLNKSVSYIKYPKACQKGLDFSHDGKYMALAERRDCKDHISIFACSTWELMKHFETDTDDLAGLKWSPDGRVLGVWESVLNYKVVIYSLDGRRLSTYSAYEHALGIKSLQWSPTSQFLAIGSFDQKVRLLNHITWKTVSVNDHPMTIEGGSRVIIYKEHERGTPIPTEELMTPSAAALFVTKSKYEIQSCPALVPVVKPDLNKANPKIGVSLVSFSPDSRYMFTKNDNMPNCLWLWDVQHLSLAVILIQASVIKCVEWDPRQSRLALCTATNKLYMWSPSGCLAVDVPAEASFQVHYLRWHPDGDAILLLSKDQMCVCFLASATSQEAS